MDPVRETAVQETPFHLAGNFAPVLEERTARELEVIGHLPPELRGTYVRNGPNPRTGASPAWFAAQGMLHGVRVEEGRALWYRNRWINGEHGPNTSVVRHAGRILTLVETRLPVEVDAQLETVGPFDFDGSLVRSMIAHPKTCPRTGELLFLSYGREAPLLTYYRASAEGRVVHTAPITVPAVTYLHDFGITERYAVIYDLPVLVGDWRSPEPLRWVDDHRARVGLVPRDGSDPDVRWFDVQPCTISHVLNAFEDGELVVLDAVRAPRIRTPHALYRFTFDLRTGRVTEDVLDARFVDFPRVHPAFEGRANRLGYSLEMRDWVNGAPTRTVSRQHATATGASKEHDFGPGRVPGECVVVPRPGATAEDDGWAILFVYDRARDASDVVLLDLQRFEDEPVATIRLPYRVPFGIHGAWLADV